MAKSSMPPAIGARDLAWGAQRWRNAGLTTKNLRACLSGYDDDVDVDSQLPLWCWRTREPTVFNALTQLLVLGQSVSSSWTRQALPNLEGWQARGFLAEHGRKITSRLALSLHGALELISDAPPRNCEQATTHVMGATNASQTLLRCLLPGKKKRSLDLGTGSGFLALHLARHSQSVVATDLNPRALQFARLNARLANASNITFKTANMFSGLPRAGFDFIAGNLPFVISPENRFVYRDGGLPGDGFSAAVIKQAGCYLADQGHAQFLVQWTHTRAGDGASAHEHEEQHLAGWVQGNGCHMLALRFRVQTVEDYILQWSHGPVAGHAWQARTRFASWMRFYERHNIAAISTGLIVLKRAAKARHAMAIRDWPAPVDDCGAEVQAHLADLERAR